MDLRLGKTKINDRCLSTTFASTRQPHNLSNMLPSEICVGTCVHVRKRTCVCTYANGNVCTFLCLRTRLKLLCTNVNMWVSKTC